jgi:superkiller protein 3
MNADAELTLAGFLHREGRLDEAREHYMVSLEGRRDDPETWADLGALEMDVGRFAEAEHAFAEALKLHAEDSGALIGMGALHERDGRFEEAISLYERAALANPKDPWPRARAQELRRALGARPGPG